MPDYSKMTDAQLKQVMQDSVAQIKKSKADQTPMGRIVTGEVNDALGPSPKPSAPLAKPAPPVNPVRGALDGFFGSGNQEGAFHKGLDFLTGRASQPATAQHPAVQGHPGLIGQAVDQAANTVKMPFTLAQGAYHAATGDQAKLHADAQRYTALVQHDPGLMSVIGAGHVAGNIGGSLAHSVAAEYAQSGGNKALAAHHTAQALALDNDTRSSIKSAVPFSGQVRDYGQVLADKTAGFANHGAAALPSAHDRAVADRNFATLRDQQPFTFALNTAAMLDPLMKGTAVGGDALLKAGHMGVNRSEETGDSIAGLLKIGDENDAMSAASQNAGDALGAAHYRSLADQARARAVGLKRTQIKAAVGGPVGNAARSTQAAIADAAATAAEKIAPGSKIARGVRRTADGLKKNAVGTAQVLHGLDSPDTEAAALDAGRRKFYQSGQAPPPGQRQLAAPVASDTAPPPSPEATQPQSAPDTTFKPTPQDNLSKKHMADSGVALPPQGDGSQWEVRSYSRAGDGHRAEVLLHGPPGTVPYRARVDWHTPEEFQAAVAAKFHLPDRADQAPRQARTQRQQPEAAQTPSAVATAPETSPQPGQAPGVIQPQQAATGLPTASVPSPVAPQPQGLGTPLITPEELGYARPGAAAPPVSASAQQPLTAALPDDAQVNQLAPRADAAPAEPSHGLFSPTPQAPPVRRVQAAATGMPPVTLGDSHSPSAGQGPQLPARPNASVSESPTGLFSPPVQPTPKPGFGSSLTRNFTAGPNNASMTFASPVQREFYDTGAKLRRANRGENRPQADLDKRHREAQDSLESLARTTGLTPNEVRQRAYDTHDDVKAQMKGVTAGESRHLADRVGEPPGGFEFRGIGGNGKPTYRPAKAPPHDGIDRSVTFDTGGHPDAGYNEDTAPGVEDADHEQPTAARSDAGTPGHGSGDQRPELAGEYGLVPDLDEGTQGRGRRDGGQVIGGTLPRPPGDQPEVRESRGRHKFIGLQQEAYHDLERLLGLEPGASAGAAMTQDRVYGVSHAGEDAIDAFIKTHRGDKEAIAEYRKHIRSITDTLEDALHHHKQGVATISLSPDQTLSQRVAVARHEITHRQNYTTPLSEEAKNRLTRKVMDPGFSHHEEAFNAIGQLLMNGYAPDRLWHEIPAIISAGPLDYERYHMTADGAKAILREYGKELVKEHGPKAFADLLQHGHTIARAAAREATGETPKTRQTGAAPEMAGPKAPQPPAKTQYAQSEDEVPPDLPTVGSLPGLVKGVKNAPRLTRADLVPTSGKSPVPGGGRAAVKGPLSSADLQVTPPKRRPGALDQISDVRKAGLVSSPRTIAKVAESHIAYLATEEASKVPAAIADIVRAAFEKNDRQVLMPHPTEMAAAALKAAIQGARDAKRILLKGPTAMSGPLWHHVPPEFHHPSPLLNAWIGMPVRGVTRAHSAVYHVARLYAADRSFQEQAALVARHEITSGKYPKSDFQKRRDYWYANPSVSMTSNAVAAAEAAVFQQDNPINSAWQSGKRAAPAWLRFGMDQAAPITHVPSNILIAGLHYATGLPLSVAQSAYDRHYKRQWGAEEQQRFAHSFGRGAVGAALILMGFWLHRHGAILGGHHVTAYGFNAEKHDPGGIDIDGRLRLKTGYLAPPGVLVSLGAYLGEQQDRRDRGEAVQATDEGTEALRVMTGDQPLTSSLDFYSASVKDPSDFVGSQAGSFIPTAVADLAAQGDEYKRRKHGLLPEIEGRIPGLRERLPIQRDAFGDPVRESNKIYDPLDMSPLGKTDSPAARLLLSLRDQERGSTRGSGRKYTPAQEAAYQQRRSLLARSRDGENIRPSLNQLVSQGHMTTREREALLSEARLSPEQALFERLTADDAVRVYTAAAKSDPKLAAQIRFPLRRKLQNDMTRHPEHRSLDAAALATLLGR